jgi:hypothetical protein
MHLVEREAGYVDASAIRMVQPKKAGFRRLFWVSGLEIRHSGFAKDGAGARPQQLALKNL